MKELSRALIVCLLAVGAQSQTPVSLCDLVRHPELYNGTAVRVRATYRYGFELQQFYCLDCLDRGKVWLEFPDDAANASWNALKRAPKGAGIVNLTAEGIFVSGGHYGHLGYAHKITVEKIGDVVVILKRIGNEAEIKKSERRWACGGTNPK